MLRSSLLIILSLLWLTIGTSAYAQSIHVIGLFANKVVLSIDGERHVLSVGESTPDGVKLLKANSQEALFEVRGKTVRHTLGHSPHYKIAPVTEDIVLIQPDLSGMYQVSGMINKRRVEFVVDTGASHIAMNATQAKKLGIKYRANGILTQVETASGIVPAYLVQLKSVKVGEIQAYNVSALVLESAQPRLILLGMSFLNKLEMTNKGRLLQLRQKY